MADANTKRLVLSKYDESHATDIHKLLCEGYENASHNNATKYCLSLINLDNDVYVICSYKGDPFKNNILNKILTYSNSEKNRTNSSIQSKGEGFSMLISKIADELWTVNCEDGKVSHLHMFDFNRHINILKKQDYEDNDINKSYVKCMHSIIDIVEDPIKISDIKNKQNGETLVKILNILKKHTNTKQHIIMKVTRENSYEELSKVFKSYEDDTKFKYYDKLSKIEQYILYYDGNNCEINDTKGSNLLYRDNLRCINESVVYYHKNPNKDSYLIKTNGRKFIPRNEGFEKYLNFEEITNDIDKENQYEDKPSLKITNGCLSKENMETFKKNIGKSTEKYAGVYYILDNIILNTTPQSYQDFYPQSAKGPRQTQLKSYGRTIIDILNKDQVKINSIKCDSRIDTRRELQLVKTIHYLYDKFIKSNAGGSRSVSWAQKTDNVNNLFIDELLQRQPQDRTKRDKTKEDVVKKEQVKDNNNVVYYNTYKNDGIYRNIYKNDKNTSIIKIGKTNRDPKKRTAELKKKTIGTLLNQSTIYINNDNTSCNNIIIETIILNILRKYAKTDENIENIKGKNNQESEQFFCKNGFNRIIKLAFAELQTYIEMNCDITSDGCEKLFETKIEEYAKRNSS